MTQNKLTRRQALAGTGLLAASALWLNSKPQAIAASPSKKAKQPFLFCLNTATIRGQKLGIVKELEVAAKAGYDAVEPWVGTIQDYMKAGGTLSDLRKRVSDLGLTVESSIAFAEWIVDDDARRTKGLEQAKREMDIVAQIGGKRIAAPPSGATNLPKLDPLAAAERYRALLEVGRQMGVVAELELWGFSKNLSRLGESVGIAIQADHPDACVLVDVYHLYKGGSDYKSMRLLGPSAIHVIHMNDYPADPPREKIDDSFRVLPGDGVAPIADILKTLHNTGGQKVLSLEIFNRKLWEQDALAVIKDGLAKMKKAAALA